MSRAAEWATRIQTVALPVSVIAAEAIDMGQAYDDELAQLRADVDRLTHERNELEQVVHTLTAADATHDEPKE